MSNANGFPSFKPSDHLNCRTLSRAARQGKGGQKGCFGHAGTDNLRQKGNPPPGGPRDELVKASLKYRQSLVPHSRPLECWISKGVFFLYQVGLSRSDAPTAPAAPRISNPPAPLRLTASPALRRAARTLPSRGSFHHCRRRTCYPAGWGIASKAEILVPGSVAEHGVVAANQINRVSSFISNHGVRGSLMSKDVVYVSKKFRPRWGGEGRCFTFGFHFKPKANGNAKSDGLEQVRTCGSPHEAEERFAGKNTKKVM